MIVVDCEQGSPDWFRARAGACTASMFGEVRKRVGALTDQQSVYVDAILGGMDEKAAREAAGYKSAPKSEGISKALRGEQVGDFTDATKAYAFRLAVERISGEPLDEADRFETYAMRRGREMEPEARAAHEFMLGVIVDPCGLVKTEDGKFGASADGLIGADGGAEYKCLMDPTRIRDVILQRDLSDLTDQVQGGLWLTGRKWWDFCLYVPALASIGKSLTVFRVERDEAYIERLEADLLVFDALVCDYEARLRG